MDFSWTLMSEDFAEQISVIGSSKKLKLLKLKSEKL